MVIINIVSIIHPTDGSYKRFVIIIRISIFSDFLIKQKFFSMNLRKKNDNNLDTRNFFSNTRLSINEKCSKSKRNNQSF